MATINAKKHKPDSSSCTAALQAVEDSLYVIGGKWKVKIIIALQDRDLRFNELQRTVTGISARVLSNELKDLEMNGFIKRNVYARTPVVVEYGLTGYCESLQEVLDSLVKWGTGHREKIKREYKSQRTRK